MTTMHNLYVVVILLFISSALPFLVPSYAENRTAGSTAMVVCFMLLVSGAALLCSAMASTTNKDSPSPSAHTDGANRGSATINGVNYDVPAGASISVINGKVSINGIQITTVQGSPDIVIEGNVGEINCGGSVTVKGEVQGHIDAGGSITCGDVQGDADAGGSITCGNVGGDIDAGGSVTNRKE